MTAVHLCVLFNHAFPKNIPILREIYKGRFSKVSYIQPIIRSDDEDVFTSGRGSYNFHGMIVDYALSRKITEDYIVFVQDDVFLNPLVNENNIKDMFRLDNFEGFLPEIHPITGKLSQWVWQFQTIWKLMFPMNFVSGSGVENWMRYLPDPETYRAKLRDTYGIDNSDMIVDINSSGPSWDHFAIPESKNALPKEAFGGLSSHFKGGETIQLPYPLCRGMSDFVIVRRDVFDKFIEYLTLFAALQLFVEIAIPTALTLASSRIGFDSDLGKRSVWLWSEDRNNLNAQHLADEFKNDLLLLHPTKLSKDTQIVNEIMSILGK